MSARLTFVGLPELKAALRALPAHLTGEAQNVVEGAANGAALSIRSAYGAHRVTGSLQKGVRVDTRAVGARAVAYVVKSTAPHAVIFEYGTEARHYVTENGVKHLTGKSPPHPIFGPAMGRARRKMHEQLRGVLTRAGLLVTGEP